jgi:adenylate cyclase
MGARHSTTNKATLEQRIAELESEIADLQLLYETTIEHGTSLENELMIQNRRMELLQNQMRKYLSPQLFSALLGGTANTTTRGHIRTKLTVYFSDMVGFSDLTDATEPELLSDVLNTYLTRMSEIALTYGGTIDKFIGDAMMVFFGAPEFVDDVDHARRCVRMALEMRTELFRLREEWRAKGITQTLRVRAGINTGFCTVGNFGSEHRMDYTIIGGQVNLAARLQSSATPDSIYLSNSTYTLVEDLVEARSLGSIQVKGIHAPVDAWEVLGLRQAHSEQAPHFELRNGRVHLRALDVDPAALSDQDRDEIEKALTRALVHLARR